MPSQFQTGAPEVTPDIGCQSIGDICDAIKDDVTYPYKKNSQTAIFQGVEPRDGLMKVLGSYINLVGFNNMASVSQTGEGKIWQATLPSNGVFNGSGGPKVVEMPLNAGDQRIRTGFKMFRDSESYKYRFFVSQLIIDGTLGAAGTEIPKNEHRILVPPFMGIFSSNEAECGCDASCTGNGWREWHLMKKDGKNEKLWVRNEPPAGVTDTRDFGKITTGPYEGWYAFYVVRGVGVHAKVGDTSTFPDSEGSPRVIELGDEIKIGTVIPVTLTGCLPSVSVRPTHYKRVEYKNAAQMMVDKVYSYTKEDVYRSTYHEEADRINQEYRRELKAVMTRGYNTMMYGQAQMFNQTDLDNIVIPGVGDIALNDQRDAIPYATDGFFTLLRKHARKASFVIEEGCDNRCLLQDFKSLIEDISNDDYANGNWVFIGDDYLFHMMQTMITNKVAPNDVNTAKEILFGANKSLLTNDMFSMNRESAIPGINNNFMQYDRIRIGSREIPFILDEEMQRREPGVIYLINLDAIEFYHPNRRIDESNGWMASTAQAGTVMPNFISNREMVKVNGQFSEYIPQNCPNSVWSYLQMGVWYSPKDLPSTFRIEMSGMTDAAVPVPLTDIACGCSNNRMNSYNAMMG